MNTERIDIATELRRVLRVIRRQAPIIVVCVVVAGGVAYAIAASQKSEYEASAQLLVQAYQPDLSFPNTPALFVDPTRARATALQLATSGPVAQRAFSQVHAARGQATVSASSNGDSDVISLTARSSSPRVAAQVANAFASAYISFRRSANEARFLTAAKDLQDKTSQLRAVVPRGRAAQHPNPHQAAQLFALSQLRSQGARLHLLAATQTGDAQVVQAAGVPSTPVSKGEVRDAALGAGFGLLLGLALAFLREQFNDRLDGEEELERLAPGIPVLAYVPAVRRRSGPMAAEAFRNLAARLHELKAPTVSHTILVTSASPEDGKTTTALNLALAFAERQDSVALVEADMRRPKLRAKAKLPANRPGVADVLGGRISSQEAFTSVKFTPSAGDGPKVVIEGEVPLLTAGKSTASPHALINERTVGTLLDGARTQARNVIVDGPPLGVVADVVPVAKQVDSVLIVVRLNHTRPRQLRRMLSQLEAIGVTPRGITVLGAELGDYYG